MTKCKSLCETQDQQTVLHPLLQWPALAKLSVINRGLLPSFNFLRFLCCSSFLSRTGAIELTS